MVNGLVQSYVMLFYSIQTLKAQHAPLTYLHSFRPIQKSTFYPSALKKADGLLSSLARAGGVDLQVCECDNSRMS